MITERDKEFYKPCADCKFAELAPNQYPCCDCDGGKWQPHHELKNLFENYGEIDSHKSDTAAYELPVPEIKDSGGRTEFKTGAVRDAQGGKGRFDLLPLMTIWGMAHHFEKGCQKYGDRNWEKGIPIKNYMDSATRHMTEFQLGFQDENHLMAAIWNLACAYDTLCRIKLGLLPKDLDNLPYPLRDCRQEDINTWSMGKEFGNDT